MHPKFALTFAPKLFSASTAPVTVHGPDPVACEANSAGGRLQHLPDAILALCKSVTYVQSARTSATPSLSRRSAS